MEVRGEASWPRGGVGVKIKIKLIRSKLEDTSEGDHGQDDDSGAFSGFSQISYLSVARSRGNGVDRHLTPRAEITSGSVSTVEPGQVIMPFYLVCDVSYSMRDDLAGLNQGVRRMRAAMLADPVVDDVTRICVLSFSDTARVLVPMAELSAARIPRLAEGGRTNYGAAFRELARVIEQDSANLISQGGRLHRPLAFFMTDGAPTDESWHQTFTSSLAVKWHPLFVPFGFRKAPEAVLRQLAYPPEWGKWYHEKTTSVEQALTGITRIVRRTATRSGHLAWPDQS